MESQTIQELEALTPVGCGFPCLRKLPYTMGEYQWVFPRSDRLLIKYVRMVAMISMP